MSIQNINIEGTGTFNDTASNFGEIVNGVFAGSSTNAGSVTVAATFQGSAENTGTVAAAVFTGSAVNTGTVATAEFRDTASNAGTVTLSAAFADSASNAGTIQGDAVFADTTTNNGTVVGVAYVAPTATNSGSVGSQETYDPAAAAYAANEAAFAYWLAHVGGYYGFCNGTERWGVNGTAYYSQADSDVAEGAYYYNNWLAASNSGHYTLYNLDKWAYQGVEVADEAAYNAAVAAANAAAYTSWFGSYQDCTHTATHGNIYTDSATLAIGVHIYTFDGSNYNQAYSDGTIVIDNTAYAFSGGSIVSINSCSGY